MKDASSCKVKTKPEKEPKQSAAEIPLLALY